MTTDEMSDEEFLRIEAEEQADAKEYARLYMIYVSEYVASVALRKRERLLGSDAAFRLWVKERQSPQLEVIKGGGRT